MALTDLSDIPLRNIFNRLPVWKILQLASLCHRLNYIKGEVFRTRTHLRLLGSSLITATEFHVMKREMNFFQMNHSQIGNDFDLIIKFENQVNVLDERELAEVGQQIELKPDMCVRHLEQTSELANVFPNVQRLTIVFNDNCGPQPLEQLLRNWPTLTHLYFVDCKYQNSNTLDYDNVTTAINNLHNLQVLAVNFSKLTGLDARTWPLEKPRPNGHLQADYGYHWNERLNRVELVEAFDRIAHFGLANFSIRGIITQHWFISKTTRIEIRLDGFQSFKIQLQQLNLTNWSALRYLNLIIFSTHSSLTQLFGQLTHCHNLQEFNLTIYDENFSVPLESVTRRLPPLPSVRRFELFTSNTTPHHLYRFKWSLPNVTELRFRLYCSTYLTSCDNLSSFYENAQWTMFLKLMPECCCEDIKRAFLIYGKEIQMFYWTYYRNGRDGNGQAELVPQVQLYTKMVAGKRRINFDLTATDF